MSFTIKNGTPVSSEPLCHSCKWVHMQRGFRDSEVVVFCDYGTLRKVPFPVRDCSDYCDRTMPSWKQMQDLALPIETNSSYKPAGFLVGISLDDEDE